MKELSISPCFLKFMGSESWTLLELWMLHHLDRSRRREELLWLDRRRFPSDVVLGAL